MEGFSYDLDQTFKLFKIKKMQILINFVFIEVSDNYGITVISNSLTTAFLSSVVWFIAIKVAL